MPSFVSRGWASRSWSTVSPAASFSRISSTGMRVPPTTGLPIMTLGSDRVSGAAIPSSNPSFGIACGTHPRRHLRRTRNLPTRIFHDPRHHCSAGLAMHLASVGTCPPGSNRRARDHGARKPSPTCRTPGYLSGMHRLDGRVSLDQRISVAGVRRMARSWTDGWSFAVRSRQTRQPRSNHGPRSCRVVGSRMGSRRILIRPGSRTTIAPAARSASTAEKFANR